MYNSNMLVIHKEKLNMDQETVGFISIMGAVLATCLSWGSNHAFWWAVFHFLCGWIYVAYWCVLKSGWFFGAGA